MSKEAKYSVSELEKVLEKERPHLVYIEEQIESFKRKNESGILRFDIRIHQMKVTDVVTTETRRKVL